MTKKIIRRLSTTLQLSHDLHPLLNRIYTARGIQSMAELELKFEALFPFSTLKDIEKAVLLLVETLKSNQRILIVGDFDADGATSTAVAIRALKSFGFQNLKYLVPNRFAFGYGLTPELVDIAKTLEPSLIITVDNGIANHAGVTRAKELGMKVIITDHHLPAETLPAADAIINPNRRDDTFPSKNMAGVGVIFYLMLALRRKLIDENWFQTQQIPSPNMASLLDLVALGTIADVVPLDQNNRILVHQGLRKIRASQCSAGIKALLFVANRDIQFTSASDLGFALGPRLNAAGRLEDMSLGIECLLTDDPVEAQTLAARLDQLNDERRVIEHDMQRQAFSLLKKIKIDQTKEPLGICLFDEEWHQGVIGILASRIKDKLHRPVIAFANGNEHEIKGSARSISGLHIRDVLAEISMKFPQILSRFGGHAMAAGLVIAKKNFSQFAKIFNDVVSSKLTDEILTHALHSDGALQKDELSLGVADVLKNGGPWGQAFPEPLFDGTFALLDQRIVGGKHLKMVLNHDDQTLDAIAFNVDLESWPNHRCEKVKIAYRMDINEFRGRRSVQLIVEQLEIALS